MRIVFMGTPAFAAASLLRLYADGYDVVGVFTQPDKPGNRGMKVRFSPVKEVAIEHGAKIYQPPGLRDDHTVNSIRELNCDIIIVTAYGKLLPKEILEIPPLGCVNIHASLLPKYRGAAPVQWAVLRGEKETGVTSMYMAEELDSGDILFSKKTRIHDDETAGELLDRLSIIGAELLSETIDAIINGKAIRIPQHHEEATFAPPLSREISPINWADNSMNIKCKVRGLCPWPTATSDIGGIVCKIFSVEIGGNRPANKRPGDIVVSGKSGLEIVSADGTIIIKELQPPGGRRMTAAEFLRGRKIVTEES